MTTPSRSPATAVQIVTDVGSGRLDPLEVVEGSLEAIAERDHRIGAFVLVRAGAARAEAAALRDRADLADLPLAGVPVAIKDNVDVAGEPTRDGSRATSPAPAQHDHPAVRRLRDAGAIVVGKTNVPELCCWGSTESSFGLTRNPWDITRGAGGSSGGSAAAVAAGMVPIALGNDGMGSIRIPAAACGLIGIKPGPGIVPSQLGASSWFGMSENGPLATTVADARLMLAVLAGDHRSAGAHDTPGCLRVAVSVKPPVVGTRVARSWRRAVETTAKLLADAGHIVDSADPPYRAIDALAMGARWTAGIAEDADRLPREDLERRIRGHIRFGVVLRAAGMQHDRWRDSWTARLEEFFDAHDVLVTPTLAQPPPPARDWHRRSWLANVWRDANFAPFAARFNVAAVPAASVPAGCDDHGLPVAVQLVAWRGGEATLLGIAQQIEAVRPWLLHPPGVADPAATTRW